eukprot:1610884-Rhodomonas_salina.1
MARGSSAMTSWQRHTLSQYREVAAYAISVPTAHRIARPLDSLPAYAMALLDSLSAYAMTVLDSLPGPAATATRQ